GSSSSLWGGPLAAPVVVHAPSARVITTSLGSAHFLVVTLEPPRPPIGGRGQNLSCGAGGGPVLVHRGPADGGGMNAPLRGRRTPSNLTWRIDRRPGQTVVELNGRVDETAELEPLRSELRGAVCFRLARVQAINSTGVREWINLIRDLPA